MYNLNVNFIPSPTTADDLQATCQGIKSGSSTFDLNHDGQVNMADFLYAVEQLAGSTLGDANLDGQFNSGDLIQVFQHGEYEDAIAKNSNWSDGDWNCDEEFDTGDLISAFQSGGYQAAAVPVHPALGLDLQQLPIVNDLLDESQSDRVTSPTHDRTPAFNAPHNSAAIARQRADRAWRVDTLFADIQGLWSGDAIRKRRPWQIEIRAFDAGDGLSSGVNDDLR